MKRLKKATPFVASRLVDVEKSVEAVWREGYSEGWDGPGTLPISLNSYYNALSLIRSLPLGFEHRPMVYGESQGGIGFDWENERGDSLTILIRDNRAIYSILYGNGDKDRGVRRLRDGKFPRSVLTILMEMYEG